MKYFIFQIFIYFILKWEIGSIILSDVELAVESGANITVTGCIISSNSTIAVNISNSIPEKSNPNQEITVIKGLDSTCSNSEIPKVKIVSASSEICREEVQR